MKSYLYNPKIKDDVFRNQDKINTDFCFDYTHFISKIDLGYLFFNALTGEIFLLDEREYNQVLSGKITEEMIEKGLVLKKHSDFFLNNFEKNHLLRGKSRSVVVMLGTKCNLNCVYCYAKKDKNKYNLNKKLFFKHLNYLKSEGVTSLNLMFHGGGEPSMYLDDIKEIVEFIKKNFESYSFSTQTNGTIFEAVKYYYENNFGLTISFDGPEIIQNMQRPKLSGEGSFEDVMKSINFLKEHNYSYGVRATLTKNSFKHIFEILSFFYKLGVAHLGESVVFQDVFHDPQNHVHELVKMFLVNDFLGRPIYFLPANILTFYRIFKHFCAPNYVFTSDGYISACFEEYRFLSNSTFHYGKVKEDGSVEIDYDQYRYLLNRSIDNLPCKSCPYRYFCAGACPYWYSYVPTGDIYTVSKKYCDAYKEHAKEIIEVLAKIHLGGKILHDTILDFGYFKYQLTDLSTPGDFVFIADLDKVLPKVLEQDSRIYIVQNASKESLNILKNKRILFKKI